MNTKHFRPTTLVAMLCDLAVEHVDGDTVDEDDVIEILAVLSANMGWSETWKAIMEHVKDDWHMTRLAVMSTLVSWVEDARNVSEE